MSLLKKGLCEYVWVNLLTLSHLKVHVERSGQLGEVSLLKLSGLGHHVNSRPATVIKHDWVAWASSI